MDVLRSNGWFVAAALLGVAWIVVGLTEAAAYALIPALAALLALAAGTIQRSVRWGVAAASTLGAACGYYLFRLKLASASEAVCDIGATLSCTSVNASAWSELAGVSVGLIGGAFYTALFVASVFGGRSAEDDARFSQLTALFALPSLAYSVVLAGVSVQLGTFCVVCITMYLVNALLLWAGLRGMRQHGRGLLHELGQLFGDKQFGTLVVVFFLAILVGRNIGEPATNGSTVATTEDGSRDYTQLYAAAGNVTFPPDTPRLGPADARYEVLEYADFACPHCARASGELKELRKLRPDVAVRFRPFALSGQCNPALPPDTSDIGRLRCAAAIAAECAGQQEKYWEMADQLFTNQGYFESEQLRFMALQIGLDVDRWEACLASPEALEAVKAAGQAGADLGIQGTPALFLRGVLPQDRWVEVTRGVPAVLELVEASEDGADLPPPDGT